MNAKPRAVVLRVAADQDIDAALACYAQESAQAAAGLLDALEQAFGQIEQHAETGSNRFARVLGMRGLKTWALQPYPYTVFYFVHEASIDVIRVLHQARDIPTILNDAE